MSIYLSLLLFGVAILLHKRRQRSLKDIFFADPSNDPDDDSIQAVNIESLKHLTWWRVLLINFAPAFAMLGDKAWLKLAIFMMLLTAVGVYINNSLLLLNSYWLPLLMPTLGFFWGWAWLLKKRRDEFEQTFPDALNIMMSAVTAGESIMQSISYVGKTLDNKVGAVFQDMGERLKLGEPPEQVFKRASKHYPYPTFLFFVVTIRANMSRGGQLKPVMARLIRVLVDSRTLDKKKSAMTSEARLSAKIVASLPFIFMVILSFISPQNLNYVLTDPSGRYVLYYVVGSETLGLFIIWLLIRGVR
ncbi:type II secretion system F family protein [Photobacterium frigidiphilum]|uniref:type II secretion system F family protein n=1 Tax=Photobacterium frigidiphilum TaxID=264736 RepID=UPI003D0ADA79